jgi:hypothetical protein
VALTHKVWSIPLAQKVYQPFDIVYPQKTNPRRVRI